MKRRAWLEDALVLGLAAALITLWLHLWLGWLLRLASSGRPSPPQLPFLVLALILLGAQVTRAALARPRRLAGAARRARWIVGTAGAGLVAAATVLTFPLQFGVRQWYLLPSLAQVAAAALPVFLAHLYAWWSGIQLGRAAIGHHTLAGVFMTGVLALAALFSLNTLTPLYSGRDTLLPVLLFFSLGLCGLALTSLRRLRAQQRTVTLTQVSLTRYWLATSAALIGLIIFAGLVTAQVLAPDAVAHLAATVELALYAALFGFALLVSPLLLAVVGALGPLVPRLVDALLALVAAFQRLGSLLRSLFASLERLVGERLPRLFTQEQLEQIFNSPVVQAGSRWSTVLLFVLVALVIFWLAVRRLNRLSPHSEDELRDSVFSMPLLLSQLRALFRRRPRRPASPPRYLPLPGAPDEPRLIVRRAYQGMLEWAQSASLPRAAGQTPRAYAEVLAGAVPQARDAIRALTSVYLVARYAAEAPSLEEARSAEGAAARLRQVAPEAVAPS